MRGQHGGDRAARARFEGNALRLVREQGDAAQHADRVAHRRDGKCVVPAAEKDPSPANVLPVIAEDTLQFMLAMAPLSGAMGPGEPGDRASRMIGRTIGEERKKFVDYILRCREQGYVAFDDDPFEIVSLFVAMAEGEWSLRLGTGMLDQLTDKMIKEHAQRVTRIFLKGLAPEKKGS